MKSNEFFYEVHHFFWYCLEKSRTFYQANMKLLSTEKDVLPQYGIILIYSRKSYAAPWGNLF